MNNKFDEMTKGFAQSVTRRQALRRFGIGLAGSVLTCLGLKSPAKAGAQTAWPTCCVYCLHFSPHPRSGCMQAAYICEPPGVSCPPYFEKGKNRYPLYAAYQQSTCDAGCGK